jgi:hypothetical protein
MTPLQMLGREVFVANNRIAPVWTDLTIMTNTMRKERP